MKRQETINRTKTAVGILRLAMAENYPLKRVCLLAESASKLHVYSRESESGAVEFSIFASRPDGLFGKLLAVEQI